MLGFGIILLPKLLLKYINLLKLPNQFLSIRFSHLLSFPQLSKKKKKKLARVLVPSVFKALLPILLMLTWTHLVFWLLRTLSIVTLAAQIIELCFFGLLRTRVHDPEPVPLWDSVNLGYRVPGMSPSSPLPKRWEVHSCPLPDDSASIWDPHSPHLMTPIPWDDSMQQIQT